MLGTPSCPARRHSRVRQHQILSDGAELLGRRATTRARLAKFLAQIATNVYLLVGLNPNELTSDDVIAMISRLNERFVARLGIVEI